MQRNYDLVVNVIWSADKSKTNMDTFSKSNRRFIPFPEFERLFLFQEVRSKISTYLSFEKNRNQLDSLKRRIEELEALESQYGFVFVGEKLWILDFMEHQRFPRYDQWVQHVFHHELKTKFQFVDFTDPDGFPMTDIKGLPLKIWRTSIDPKIVLTGLQWHRICLIGSELELNVYGTTECPSTIHLVKMFEFLHLLEYMIDLYTLRSSVENLQDTELVALSVEHPSAVMSWTIDFISSYSSWDFHINHRRYTY